MDRRTRYLHGIDRARQALAEWRRRELQRQVPRRVSETRMVSFARRSEGTDRRMATSLQRGAPTFEPRLPHAQRVRDSRSKTSAPSCNGPGRCGTSGLRAPARCSTVPSGTNAAIRRSRLKLTVVRRIGAGQHDYLDLWSYDGRLDRIHHALYVECRERGEREASPTAAIIDSQSVKSAEKGGPVSIRSAMMRERRSKTSSATFL